MTLESIPNESESTFFEIEKALEEFIEGAVGRLQAEDGEGARLAALTENYKKILKEKDEIIQEFQAKLTEKEATFLRDKKRIEAKVDKLNAEIESSAQLEAQNRKLQSRLESLKGEVDRLMCENERMREEIQEKNELAATIDLSATESQRRVAKLRSKMSLAREKSSHLEEQLQILSQSLEDKDLELIQCKEKIRFAFEENRNLEVLVAKLEDKYAALKVKKVMLKEKLKRYELAPEHLNFVDF